MVFDYTEKALAMTHHDHYDVSDLPEGVEVVPPAEKRTEEQWDAIYKSLHSLKKHKINS